MNEFTRMDCSHQAKKTKKNAKKNTQGHKTLTKQRKLPPLLYISIQRRQFTFFPARDALW